MNTLALISYSKNPTARHSSERFNRPHSELTHCRNCLVRNSEEALKKTQMYVLELFIQVYTDPVYNSFQLSLSDPFRYKLIPLFQTTTSCALDHKSRDQ